MDPTDLLVLHEEVVVFPVAQLAPTVRAAIECDPDDYAVTRRRSRRTTRIVDRASADLIDQFRKPSSVIDAIRRYSAQAGLQPEDVVESCVPLLNEMINDGFIVPVGTESSGEDTDQLQIGSFVGGWKVLEALQLVEDTEVYRVESAEGVEGALKRVLADAEPWVIGALRNELRILRHLEGTTSPAPLVDGTGAKDPYLVISWCEGTPILSTASRIRRPWSIDGRRKVADLCVAVLDAYVELHRRDVIHGDVHPRNLLFDSERGLVHVVDFGFGRLASEDANTGLSGGVSAFFAPEYAAASLAEEHVPPATAASEQYSIAALIYMVLTGEDYLHPMLQGRRWWEAVCTQPPREFSRLGIPPAPAIEAVLARALAKSVDQRFGSMSEFRDRFADAVEADGRPKASAPRTRAWTPPGLFGALTARFDLDGELDRVLSSPTATVNYGSAGIAYLLYRASCLQDRADLVALADVWIERARLALAATPTEACFDATMGLEPETIGRTALYHSPVGVHCVEALVACALGDDTRADQAIGRFIAAAETTEERDDLTTGRAGHLLGSAIMLEAARAAGYAEGPLLAFGRRRQAELVSNWSSCMTTVAGAGDPYLGIAHGWAGLAFALLRFSSLALEPVAPALIAGLHELAALAHRDGDRAWWPRGPGDNVSWPGWCHGSAGYAMLWAQAHRVLPDDRFIELARMAAEHAWSEPSPTGHLCCGAAGQAYAFLSLHRLTGEGVYADRARTMLDRSMTLIGSPGMRRDSLYKGDVGVALLEADLVEPYLSAMPMFESEGWPAS